MRPKSEGFVRKAEANRRKKVASGTYVLKPKYRSKAQRTEVKKDTRKTLTYLANAQQSEHRRHVRSYGKADAIIASRVKRNVGPPRAYRDAPWNDPVWRLMAKGLKAISSESKYRKANEAEFYRRAGGKIVDARYRPPKVSTKIKRTDGRKGLGRTLQYREGADEPSYVWPDEYVSKKNRRKFEESDAWFSGRKRRV